MKYLLFTSLSRTAVGFLIVSFVLLLVIGHVVTPMSGGPLGILAVFTLIYVFCTSLSLLITGVISVIGRKLSNRPLMDDRRRYYVSSVLGFLPVLYLTLVSMGGATVWGIGLIALFIGLMLFYVLRRSA